MKLFIINTNKQADIRYELEMISEQKCAAYRSTKSEINGIKKGDKVLLYSNQKGIIARGVADGLVKKKEDRGEIDAEYYMSLNEFYEYIKPIPYPKVRLIIETADSTFSRPFNVTSLKFDSPVSKEIWDGLCNYV